MSWTEENENRLYEIIASLGEEEELPPDLIPLPPSPLPDIEDTDESINSTIKEIRDDIKSSSPTMIKNKLLYIISHLKQFPPRPKISDAIQEIREIIEALSKSARLHPNSRLRQFTLTPKEYIKQNLTHQVSKPGTRWPSSVSKGSTTRRSRRDFSRSRKSRRASRKSKTRRSKYRK